MVLCVSIATFTRARRAITEDIFQLYDDAPQQRTHAVRGEYLAYFNIILIANIYTYQQKKRKK